jgi:hypothetical protein
MPDREDALGTGEEDDRSGNLGLDWAGRAPDSSVAPL